MNNIMNKVPDTFKPKPNSMWLVEVECRQNVVVVGGDGEGFFIPGQEPYWDLSHVSKWISEIIPDQLHQDKVAGKMLPIMENQVKNWERQYNRATTHYKNGVDSLRQYVAYLENEIVQLTNKIDYLEGNCE